MSKTRTYRIWAGVVKRCTNPNHKNFDRYSQLGIAPEFLVFSAFYAQLGECPEGWTIDRVDNEKGYFPGNVRWADWTTQARNRDDVHSITHNGETRCLVEWEVLLGIPKGRLADRINNLGWDPVRALTEPVRQQHTGTQKKPWHSQLTFNGATLSISEWSAILKIPASRIHSRINRGWDPERALTTPALNNYRWAHRRASSAFSKLNPALR